jgi:hypothetical protein
MACAELLKILIVVNGQRYPLKPSPPVRNPGTLTIEDLFKMLEGYGSDVPHVTYNGVRVPLTMHLDHPAM